MNFIDKKVSVKRAVAILAKKGIKVDDGEANVILDFLYLITKNYNKSDENQNPKP